MGVNVQIWKQTISYKNIFIFLKNSVINFVINNYNLKVHKRTFENLKFSKGEYIFNILCNLKNFQIQINKIIQNFGNKLTKFKQYKKNCQTSGQFRNI